MASEELFSLVKRLSEAIGCGGDEEEVVKIITSELEGKAELRRDKMGNLIAKVGSGKPRIMLAAHMDEIGLMVKHIEDRGFIKFAKLGGINDHILLGQRVKLKTSDGSYVYGVIGSKPIHLLKEEERKQVVSYEKMFIDVGVRSREAAEKLGLKVGCVATFDRTMERMGELICGKAFDDRLGCAALIEVLKQAEPKCEVLACFTVQEELGLKGATTSAFALEPDIGIAIDTTIAGDFPGMEPHEAPVEIGKGATIVVAYGRKESLGYGLIPSRKIREWLEGLAKRNNLPYQLEVVEGGTTDAAAIALSRGGVPAAAVSIPTRYLHTPIEVASLNDLEMTIRLLKLAVENPPSEY